MIQGQTLPGIWFICHLRTSPIPPNDGPSWLWAQNALQCLFQFGVTFPSFQVPMAPQPCSLTLSHSNSDSATASKCSIVSEKAPAPEKRYGVMSGRETVTVPTLVLAPLHWSFLWPTVVRLEYLTQFHRWGSCRLRNCRWLLISKQFWPISECVTVPGCCVSIDELVIHY